MVGGEVYLHCQLRLSDFAAHARMWLREKSGLIRRRASKGGAFSAAHGRIGLDILYRLETFWPWSPHSLVAVDAV